MIIDIHCHIAPPAWAQTKPLPRSLVQIERFFAEKEAAGISLSVISNPMMNIPGTQQNDLELDKIREYEEFVLSLIDQHPGKVVSFLGVNPFGGQQLLYEVERAIKQPEFKGVMVNSSIEGRYLDAPEARDFWALVGSQGIPVFIHPPAMPPASRGVQDYRLIENAVRWNDTSLGLAAIIFAGILEKYPTLSLISAMGGGGLAMLKGRLDFGYQHKELIPRNITPPRDLLSLPPSAAFKQIYVDSCTYSAQALSMNIATLGADHVLFGTDVPPSPTATSTALQFLQAMPISQEEKELILWKNTSRLLHLEGLHS
jgi:aminocarboxymuconate-semialdehyde decarboxylase